LVQDERLMFEKESQQFYIQTEEKDAPNCNWWWRMYGPLSSYAVGGHFQTGSGPEAVLKGSFLFRWVG
jgi:hypothetical protein